MPEISVMVEGGKASAGAPLGPALGPLGVNIGEVVNEINQKTKEYAGMKIPVKVNVDPASRTFTIRVGSPPISALIKKEVGADKLAANPKTEQKGNLTFDKVLKIAKMKIVNMGSYNLKAAVREVVGSCNSSGVYVEGMHAKEFQAELASGKWDSKIK